MKLIIRILFIGAITYFLSPFTAWWLCMVAAFAVSFISPASGLNTFISGFLGAGLVWMGHAWTLDVANQSSFSALIAQIIGANDPIILVLAAGAIGGLAGGFAAVTGKTFRALFTKSKQRSLYN